MKNLMWCAVFFAVFGVLAGVLSGDGQAAAEKLVSGVFFMIIIGVIWGGWTLLKKGIDKTKK